MPPVEQAEIEHRLSRVEAEVRTIPEMRADIHSMRSEITEIRVAEGRTITQLEILGDDIKAIRRRLEDDSPKIDVKTVLMIIAILAGSVGGTAFQSIAEAGSVPHLAP